MNMPAIYSIVYQPEHKKYGRHSGAFIRDPLPEATLIANHGIQGDAKAGRNSRRQLNLLALEWLQELEPAGYNIQPGAFGEQIIVQGLSFAELRPGDQLNLGAEALIEITKPRETCIRLEAAQGLPNETFGHVAGFLARVLTGGVIRVGDAVRKVEHSGSSAT